jgi:general secretion pathway protein A
MMAAFNEDRDYVTVADIASAVEELQWLEFASRTMAIAAKVASAASSSSDRTSRVLAKLVLSTDGKTLSELHLIPGRKVIGRTPDNDLQIDSKFISRHHCQLVTGSDGVTVIEDLNSTNGIVVHGKRVRRHTLRDGDVVSVGQHDIRYVNEHVGEHLVDTHDDLPRVDVNAANEDADEDAAPEDAAGAR